MSIPLLMLVAGRRQRFHEIEDHDTGNTMRHLDDKLPSSQ